MHLFNISKEANMKNKWMRRILRTLGIAIVAFLLIRFGIPAVSSGLAYAVIIRVAGIVSLLLVIISLSSD